VLLCRQDGKLERDPAHETFMNQPYRAAQGGVLFVTYGNGHIAKVAPVAKALEAQGIRCTVLALTLGYAQARRMGLEPTGYNDLLQLVDRDKALAYGARLIAENNHPDVDEAESRAYLGINYLDWVEQYGEEEAARRYAQGGRRSFLPVRFMGKVIDHYRPDVVVSTSSPRSEQAAIEAAVARGVPSLTMLDVFANPHDTYLHHEVYADRITAPSPIAGEQLRRAGIDPARIRVTGCPAYDHLRERTHAAEGVALKRSLGWTALNVLLWAGSLEADAPGVPPEYSGTGLCELVETRLRAWVRGRSDVALIVRYHPTQYHLYPDRGAQERVYVSNPGKDPLRAQLEACDTVLVQTSTVGFEAAVMGKRVLNLAFSPTVIRTEYDFSKLGVAEGVSSLDELTRVLDRPRAPLADVGGLPPPGDATSRVVAEIIALMRGSEPPEAQRQSEIRR
jgi:hypothetical protein